MKKRIFIYYAFKYKFYLKIFESFLDHTQLVIFFTQILLGRDSLTQVIPFGIAQESWLRGDCDVEGGVGVGQIRNVENREGRLCVASVKVVDGVERNMEMTVEGEVEYKTEKKGKKLEAVMVRLVKKVE